MHCIDGYGPVVFSDGISCADYLSDCMSDKGGCPLWHVSRNGQCECGASLNGIVSCDEKFVFIQRGNCVTWNNSTNSAELHRCLFSHWDYNDTCDRYPIPDT